MPTMEVGLDASRFISGVSQVEDGSRRITTVTAQAARSIGNAFTGNLASAGQNIALTARSLGELNTTAAAFSASRVLLEIGQTATDFSLLRAQVGGTASAWGVLGAVWRANPIGVIATGVGLLAAGMSLFSRNTKEATSEFEKFAASTRQSDARLRAGRGFGVGDIEAQVLRERRANLFGYATQIEAAGKPVGADEFARTSGIPLDSLTRQIQERQIEIQPRAGYSIIEALAGGKYDLSPGVAVSTLGQYSRDIGRQADASQFQTEQYVAGERYRIQAADAREEARLRAEQENYEASVRASEEIRRNFEAAGQEIGAVVANIVLAGGGIRDILAALARQGAGSAITSGFGFLGSAIGATFTQNQQNAGVGVPGGG